MQNNIDKTHTLLCKIGKSFGYKGQARVMFYTDFPESIEIESPFILSDGKKIIKEIYIESIDFNKSIAKFKNVDSKEDVKGSLTNRFIYTDIGNTLENIELEENEHFFFELIGAEVLDDDGTKLGNVIDVERYVSTDYLIVKFDDKKEFLIPYIDRYIDRFDKDNKIVYSIDARHILEES